MAADLHIHIADEKVENDVRESQKMAYWSSQGGNCDKDGNPLKYDEEAVHSTPSVWIGEVSWLKASLMEDTETFVPSTMGRISEIVGRDLPVIDEEFIANVMSAFSLPNSTSYSLADPDEVRAFLEEHKGKKAFQISW